MDVPVISAISDTIKGVFGFIDDLHTSEEEKLTLKSKMFMMQGELMGTVFDYEKSIAEMKMQAITAEAKSEHWIVAAWRPLTMLTFVGLVVARWLGLTDSTISPELEEQLMLLIQIGLGGYVVGRSAEKVAKAINFKKAIETE